VKRVWAYLSTSTETVEVPLTMIDAEILRLTRCVPRTTAERAFHAWLITWRDNNKKP